MSGIERLERTDVQNGSRKQDVCVCVSRTGWLNSGRGENGGLSHGPDFG